MDGASAYTTRDVKRFVVDNMDALRVRHLPVATQKFSGIEEYWHQAKRNVMASQYYNDEQKLFNICGHKLCREVLDRKSVV